MFSMQNLLIVSAQKLVDSLCMCTPVCACMNMYAPLFCFLVWDAMVSETSFLFDDNYNPKSFSKGKHSNHVSIPALP
jgi:hypothetical protein